MKKPLIGVSILAVVFLVLGSLSTVVGYQSVKSTTMNDSPLFQTRTQRATNQQQNILTSQYLGMGKGNFLQFPITDHKIDSMKKVIKFICKMNDKTFEQFTELCMQRARQVDTLRNADPNEIKLTLQLLQTHPETIIFTLYNRNNESVSTLFLCIFEVILYILGFILALLFVFINTTAYTLCAVWECHS